MTLPYGEFYVEQPNSLPYRPDSQPLMSHNVWQLSNVYPFINGTVGHSQYDGWAFTVSGLASGIVNTYKYWERRLEASGQGLTKYALHIIGIGNGSRDPNNINYNANWLMHDQVDLQIGATGSGPSYNEYLAPWAPTGIANMLAWGTGFWPLLKSLFVASGLRNPDVMAITTEQFADATLGLQINGTGWVDRALADPRSDSILFNGVETFRQYWNRVGAPTGTDLVDAGGVEGWRYLPENEPIRHKFGAAYQMGHTYATKKGIIEPFTAQFGDVPVFEYLFFASTSGAQVHRTYPNSPEYLVTEFGLTATSPDWYSSYVRLHNDVDPDPPPYWDSDYGWQQIYPKPDESSLTPRQYASLQYGYAKVLGAKNAAPGKPVIPFISTELDSSNITIMILFLKFCLENGIYQFAIFEGDHLSTTEGADIWYEIISTLNAYVDYVNYTRPFYSTSSIIRLGGAYLKY